MERVGNGLKPVRHASSATPTISLSRGCRQLCITALSPMGGLFSTQRCDFLFFEWYREFRRRGHRIPPGSDWGHDMSMSNWKSQNHVRLCFYPKCQFRIRPTEDHE